MGGDTPYLPLILEETLLLLRASLPSTIELRLSLETHAGMVLADPVQIQQVVMNLCANAEYAMRPKGGQLEICLDSVDIDATMAAALQTSCRDLTYASPSGILAMA